MEYRLLRRFDFVSKTAGNIVPIQVICNTRKGMHHPENNGLSRRPEITRDPLIEGHISNVV